jgi:glycerate kinase
MPDCDTMNHSEAIPHVILVVAEPFEKTAHAEAVADAIGRGLRSDDPTLGVDAYLIEEIEASAAQPSGADAVKLRASLEAADFDRRMRRARAVVIAAERLDRQTLLQRGAVFEIATRARQSGVPCYAVSGCNELDPFEARILDLQVVLQAGDVRGLRAAGRKLAEIA